MDLRDEIKKVVKWKKGVSEQMKEKIISKAEDSPLVWEMRRIGAEYVKAVDELNESVEHYNESGEHNLETEDGFKHRMKVIDDRYDASVDEAYKKYGSIVAYGWNLKVRKIPRISKP